VPELPEVEIVRRGLNRVTLHQPVVAVAVQLPRIIAHPTPAAFIAGLTGARLDQWQRRGKYLYAPLRQDGHDGGYLGVHLRMTGQLLWLDPDTPVQPHCRVRLYLSDPGGGKRELRFVDQRTFGRLWWVPPGQSPETVITGLTRLGPEPFAAEFTPAYLQQQLRRRSSAIKTALLDQKLVAGLGNIYADEALFLAGIRPTTPACRLNLPQLKRLHGAVKQVLTASIESGGTTFSDYRDIHGTNGNYGGVAWVYGRRGEPCRRCHAPIERIKLGGRSTHFCPRCQA